MGYTTREGVRALPVHNLHKRLLRSEHIKLAHFADDVAALIKAKSRRLNTWLLKLKSGAHGGEQWGKKS